MSNRTTAHALPTPIALGPPLHRRLAANVAAAIERRAQAWQRHAEQRAAERRAAAQHAALAELDARTLRDIGLGDWVTPRSQQRDFIWGGTDRFPF